jgi:hypothetical protein
VLVRAVPGWWQLLAVPAAVAILWFALFPLTAAVNATNRPPTRCGKPAPAGYGLPYRNVAFRTSDRVRLCRDRRARPGRWAAQGYRGTMR